MDKYCDPSQILIQPELKIYQVAKLLILTFVYQQMTCRAVFVNFLVQIVILVRGCSL